MTTDNTELIKRLRASAYNEEHTDIVADLLDAADMLAADAPEQLLQSVAEFVELQNQLPSLEQAIVWLINALRLSKGWTTVYANAIVRDAIDRTAPQARELSNDELEQIVQSAIRVHMQNYPSAAKNACVEVAYEVARAVLLYIANRSEA